MLRTLQFIFLVNCCLYVGISPLFSQSNTFNDFTKLYTGDSLAISSLELLIDLELFNNFIQTVNYKNPEQFKLDSIVAGNDSPSIKFEYRLTDTLDALFLFTWDNGNNYWTPSNMSLWHYNKNGLLFKQSYNPWNGDFTNLDESNATLIRTYTYNPDNLLSDYKDQTYNDIQNNKYSNHHTYHYDSTNVLDSINMYFWKNDRDTSMLVDKFIYKNSQGLLIESKHYKFDEFGNIERGDSVIYSYNHDGNIELESIYLWNEGHGFSIPELKMYQYNPDRTVNNIIVQTLNEEEEFVTVLLEEYDYYPYGSIESITNKRRNSTGILFIEEMTSYDHDESIMKSQIKLPRYREAIIPDYHIQSHMLLTETVYKGNSLSLDQWYNYYYSDIRTSVTNDNLVYNNDVILYPNPTSSTIDFEIEGNYSELEFVIFNINGQVVLNGNYDNSSINISALPQGIYSCFLKIDGKVTTKKLAIIK